MSEVNEHYENVRRTLERGLSLAESSPMESNYIDIFTHALDELARGHANYATELGDDR